jgi:hypothetical protein
LLRVTHEQYAFTPPLKADLSAAGRVKEISEKSRNLRKSLSSAGDKVLFESSLKFPLTNLLLYFYNGFVAWKAVGMANFYFFYFYFGKSHP